MTAKKRIVAMVLALSVFSSTFGMIGAAAADAESLETPDKPAFTVTVVSAGADEAGASSDSDASKADAPAEGENKDGEPAQGTTDSESTGSEGSDSESSSSDVTTIQRPEQSETVETLPGTAEDNKDHIKADADKKDEQPAGSETQPETPAESESTGKDTDKAEQPASSPASSDTTEEKPEQKPEEKPADDLDYTVAYDQETGHFKVTFNIKADAKGDQTIELSRVQEVVSKYGAAYLETDEGKNDLAEARFYGDKTMTYTYNGVKYVYYLDTDTVSLYNEPGCTTVFDVALSNGSKHTYVYKNNSLTVATPDVSNTDKTGATGFDGQELPKEYAGKTNLELKYSKTAESGCMEDLVDAALAKYGEVQHQNQFLDSDGKLTTQSTKTDVPAGTEVELINGKYYVKSGDHYYGAFSKNDIQTTEDGKTVLNKDKKGTYTLAYKKTKNGKKIEPDYYVGPFTHSSGALMTSDIRKALTPYMKEKGYETYDDYILDYYRKPNGSKYDSVSDLLKNDSNALRDLSRSGWGMPDNPSTGNNTVKMDPATLYDNFYQNVLSFKVGDPKKVDSEASGNEDHGHSHGQWAADGTQETIGDYMAGKLNETPGAWEKANNYFNTLLAAGLTSKEATWAAFTMATNIDFQNAGNNYQNTAWNWYASMVLHQTDGTLDLTKVDSKTGETIGDDDGEDQTSFYLWKYETDKTSGEESTLYYTKVPDKLDDNGNVISAGYYGWVKYDPDNKSMSYTITTTNGKLNIDYAMLEDVVYYLQEAVAPDGYDVDTTVYVICDEDTYQELKESGKTIVNVAAGTTSSAADLEHLGAIEGGKTLTVKFLNSKTVPPVVIPDPDEPDPTVPENPTPDEPTAPEEVPQPENPETPVEPAQPAAPEVAPGTPVLPKTGTTDWLVAVLMSAGFAFTAAGVFFSRKQYASKH